MYSTSSLPGFTAEMSLRNTPRRYRPSLAPASSFRTGVTPCYGDKYCPPGHCDIDCGAWGPHYAQTTCGNGQKGHCWCDKSFAGWAQANCRCEAGDPPKPPKTTSCSIAPSPYYCWFGGAGVSGTDPGCSATCDPGYHPVCAPWSCDGTQWTQSVCMCMPTIII